MEDGIDICRNVQSDDPKRFSVDRWGLRRGGCTNSNSKLDPAAASAALPKIRQQQEVQAKELQQQKRQQRPPVSKFTSAFVDTKQQPDKSRPVSAHSREAEEKQIDAEEDIDDHPTDDLRLIQHLLIEEQAELLRLRKRSQSRGGGGQGVQVAAPDEGDW